MKIAKFTDTFGSVDGVSWTLTEQLKEAHRSGKDYTIVSCVGNSPMPGHTYFEPVGMISAPEYEGQKLCWPPLLKMLEYCYNNQFTLIQAATPGSVGLAGLIIARVLGLSFQAVYHTQIPEFIGKATGERFMEAAARKYCVWFYDSADKVFTPSEHTKSYLIQHGVRREKIKVYPRGINNVFFHPSKRSNYWAEKWGVPRESMKGLFVGRVSREKDVPLLVKVFKALTDELKSAANPASSPHITLLAVGSGAYEDEMRRECEGYPVVLTGELHGEELATASASADFFVFPSTTDTFGRVVLEAMASGLPCIVSDTGGPQENIHHGVNGLVFKSNDGQSLKDAIIKLAWDPSRREMGARAREAVEQRSLTEAFERFWELY